MNFPIYFWPKMHPLVKKVVFWSIPPACIITSFLTILNLRFPLIGHDYCYFFSFITAGRWHFSRQFILPFQYSAQMCSGLPIYGNPHDIYYSITQFCGLLFSTWTATNVSTAIHILIGYIGYYIFSRKILDFSSIWAHALSTVMLCNGFVMLHLLSAHTWILPFFLLGWFLLLLFDRTPLSGYALLRRTCLFALLIAVILYSAGFQFLIMASLGLILFLPTYFSLLLFQKNFGVLDFLTILFRLTIFGIVALLLNASKLVSIYSFMRFFPRKEVLLPINENIFAYAFKAMWAIPQNAKTLYEGMPWDFHEKSMFVSHMVIIGLLCGMLLIFLKWKLILKGNKWKIILLTFSTVIGFFLLSEIITGTGLTINLIRDLPVFSSLRVTNRFLYILTVPLSILGIWSLYKTTTLFLPAQSKLVALGVTVGTIALFLVIHIDASSQVGTQNYSGLESWSQKLEQNDFLHSSVDEISDGETFLGTSSIYCCDTHLAAAGSPQANFLKKGPVTSMNESGEFNLINPVCYQYPHENDCNTSPNFKEDNKATFDAFRNGEYVHWNVSLLQKITNRLFLLVFLLCIFVIFLPRALQEHLLFTTLPKLRRQLCALCRILLKIYFHSKICILRATFLFLLFLLLGFLYINAVQFGLLSQDQNYLHQPFSTQQHIDGSSQLELELPTGIIHPLIWTLNPDDCIEDLRINNRKVQGISYPLCTKKTIFLQRYIHVGYNKILIRAVNNEGAPAGFALTISLFDPIRGIGYLWLFMTITWYLSQIVKLRPLSWRE